MEDSSPPVWATFYSACYNGDFKTVQQMMAPSTVDMTDSDGNTALHIASSKGFTEIVQILLRYHALRTIKNEDGKTAEELATKEEIKALFEAAIRPETDSQRFVAEEPDVEWIDTYKNAYRIAYENLEHMKRWLLKVPLIKLLDEILNGYIDKISFKSEDGKKRLKEYIQDSIVLEDPLGVAQAYTFPGVPFYKILNHDLAEIGSNFRFLSTQNLFNSGYLDNEAPKDLGQHIFAAILINHPRFQPYYHTGTTYRGMNITPDDLKEYEKGKIVMTRSFLSTSKKRDMAELFISYNDIDRPPVMCIYKIIQQRSSLAIAPLSEIPGEDEVLIVPFVVFEIKEHQDAEIIREGKPCRITEIELEECASNLP